MYSTRNYTQNFGILYGATYLFETELSSYIVKAYDENILKLFENDICFVCVIKSET